MDTRVGRWFQEQNLATGLLDERKSSQSVMFLGDEVALVIPDNVDDVEIGIEMTGNVAAL